jgi:protein CpxP
MTMKRNAMAMVIGLSMVLGAAQTWAQCPKGEGRGGFHGHGHRGGFMMHDGMKAELNLTAEQSKEMDQLHEEMMSNAKPLRDQLKTLKEKMHDLWSDDYPDEGAIISLKREMSALRLQLSELKIQMKLDMMEILTADQRAKLKEMKGKYKGKHGKHGKHGKGGCGDCPHGNAKK